MGPDSDGYTDGVWVAKAQGAKPHYDTHDVFVLQVAGSKSWTIYGTPVESPLAGQDFDAAVHALGAVTLQFELHAGDVAYIPRGVAHDARSSEDVSLHITAGILRSTWADLLLELVADVCLNDPTFRKSLPPGFTREGFDRAQALDTLQNLLQRLPAKANFEGILDRFVDEFLSTCPPLLRGQLAQLAALDHLTIQSMVGRGRALSPACEPRETRPRSSATRAGSPFHPTPARRSASLSPILNSRSASFRPIWTMRASSPWSEGSSAKACWCLGPLRPSLSSPLYEAVRKEAQRRVEAIRLLTHPGGARRRTGR